MEKIRPVPWSDYLFAAAALLVASLAAALLKREIGLQRVFFTVRLPAELALSPGCRPMAAAM